jgi:GntR family transcriptional regulator, rspAB operon transcriptional repressor
MVDRLARPGGSVAPLGSGEVEAGPGRRSLTEQVYDALKREILTARLRPSQPLIENELAARFGVSKTPIREALRLLVQDGWIVVLPRKGYLVAPLSLEDVREVFALRLMLEPQVTGDAATRARALQPSSGSPDLVARLRRAAAAGPRGEEPSYQSTMRAARAFHLTVAGASGNRRLLRVLEALLDEVERLLHLMPQLGDHVTAMVEPAAHERIIAAIEAGDAEQAAAHMRAHLAEVSSILVDAFGRVR